MIYYFYRASFGIPLFAKSNGIHLYAGKTRITQERIVWWMPTNWLAITALAILVPTRAIWRKVRQ